MKFTARVGTAQGPVESGRVEMVTIEGRELVTIGRGKLTDGTLTLDADPGAIWGIRIDQKAIVALPISATTEPVDLGDIVMIADGLRWPVFHSPDGKVYGVPAAVLARKLDVPPAEPPTPPDAGTPRVRGKMTFGDMFGTTARQLATAAAATRSNFALSGATVTLKGLPSATEDAISLEFPAAEALVNSTGLSEVSFSIKARGDASAPAEPPPAGPSVPNLVGYTREFALRKAAAAGFVTEVNSEIVSRGTDAGCVVRHLPAAGTELNAGGLIRLYIGKTGEQ